MVRSFLPQIDKLERIEKGKGERLKLWFKMSRKYSLILIRLKLWFKMSRKYSLILIVEIFETTKVLKIISAWNTDRKWQNKLKQ